MRQMFVMVVLDGWGIGAEDQTNPVHVVNPQTFSWLRENFPMTSLQASGISVGLPWGETGNSEVGHLTLGAGTVIYQFFPKITMAIEDETFYQNEALKGAFAHARKNNSVVHLMGLLTGASTHAALSHLQALIKMGERENVPVQMDLFADGKDSPPFTIEGLLGKVPQDKLGTLIGRYYAMDRKGNWALTKDAYECLTGTGGAVVPDPLPAIKETYQRNLSEEFLVPLRIGDGEKYVRDNDAVIFFNFREDSIRQIAEPFILPHCDKFPYRKLENLYVTTMTHYRDDFNVPVAFPADEVKKCLGAVLAEAGKSQLRVAETYKYAHVTYFFNGHREEPFANEYRVVVPSPTTIHPDDHPELMAKELTDRVVEALQSQAFDFILMNYANPDTIAHTGNFNASVEAVKVVDRELGRVVKAVIDAGATLIVTADHGNVEELVSPSTGMPETQHDGNPVPCYVVAPHLKGKKFYNHQNLRGETTGILSDVAPTMLELMGIPKPPEMSGESLLKNLL